MSTGTRIIKAILLTLLSALVIAGCAPSRSGRVYTRDEARQVQTVETGTIESVKEVLIEGTKTPIGAAAGGIAGGVAGHSVGGGSGKAVATVIGALAGAAAGAVAEEGITRKPGLEIVVKKDNGRTIVVVQEADMDLAPGDRVRIISSSEGNTRVSK
ncbi:glycine zipper 2TM domain-containing protein [Desulfospira joergensenii]|uniref:glycine zipper 2TM domain-containing protein n=1 Tax=Desulfospira joergensenii TaxID=53329 RepID=UPI000489ECA0|nr:glycine zipper 2TM domain-containing protein [Desulfospira joergensenii]